MKKSIVMAVFALVTLSMVSCKEEEKKEETAAPIESTAEATDKEDMHIAAYQCPMDCEKGKTYAEKGTCPVCNMDLVLVEENHEEHNH